MKAIRNLARHRYFCEILRRVDRLPATRNCLQITTFCIKLTFGATDMAEAVRTYLLKVDPVVGVARGGKAWD